MARYRPYWDKKRETLPPGEREKIILEKIRRQLSYVYETMPFYRRLYEAHGVEPSKIRSLESFSRRVPVVTKDMLRASQAEHPPFGDYLGVTRPQLARVHGSSGTTGKPTLFGLSKRDWRYVNETLAMCFWTAGVRPTDLMQISMHFGLFTGSWAALSAAERIGATALPLGAGETERQIHLMYEAGATVLCAIPSYGLRMLEVGRQMGFDTAASPLRLGIFVGEPGAGIPAVKRALETGWGIQAIDFGTTSEMHPGTNVECEYRLGMHAYIDTVYTEIVDPRDPQRRLPMGERGAVVYSHLDRESQPMIRFWSGDLSRMADDPCPCGRTYPRLPDGILGRVDDMLIIRGVNVYPSAVHACLAEIEGLGAEFQIVLSTRGSMDEALVRAEVDEPVWSRAGGSETGEALQGLRDLVGKRLQAELGVRFDVELLRPGSLDRPAGKARRVVDHRRRVSVAPEMSG